MSNIEKVDFGVKEHKGKIVTSSRRVAEVFEKRHDNVIQAIREAIETTKNFAPDFSGTNFIQSEYTLRGRKYPEYLLTKDGLVYTVMGFTGEKAAKFKIAYIEAFNRMEEQLKALKIARMEFPDFTDAIAALHEEPKHYHFSNECDMINRLVLGMNAKKFREAFGIKKGDSIRPYLTAEQIRMIEKLQKYDTALLESGFDYQERKQRLTEYYEKLKSIRLITNKGCP